MSEVKEGTTSFHDYAILDEDGVAIETVDGLEYKVSNNLGAALVAWTSVAAPAGTGTITVSASVNTKTSPADVKRYVTLRATYDTTSKVVNEFDYNIVDMVGI